MPVERPIRETKRAAKGLATYRRKAAITPSRLSLQDGGAHDPGPFRPFPGKRRSRRRFAPRPSELRRAPRRKRKQGPR